MVAPIVFKTPKGRAPAMPGRPAPQGSAKQKGIVSTRTEIKGQEIGSSYEANVADALDLLGWGYSYQVALHYGRERRGGIVLDFLVYTAPLATPIFVNGRYWHGQRVEQDLLQQKSLHRYLHTPSREALIMWDENCLTVDDAYAFLLLNIGRGGP